MSLAPETAQQIELSRPTRRTIVPFALVVALGVGSTFLSPYSNGTIEPAFFLLVLIIDVVIFVVSLRRTGRTWADPAGPWLFFVAFILMRDEAGGASAGTAPLVILPMIWLAMFGTKRDLLVGAALTAASFMVPVLLVGPPAYPLDEWRRAVLWTSLALLIAPVIQRLVAQLAVETKREKAMSAEVAGLMRGARLSSLIATDTAGLITSFGVGAEELLGYRADEMVGLHYSDLLHDRVEVVAVAAELGVEPGFGVFAELAHATAESRIWTFVRADGERIFVRLAVTELLDTRSELTGYLGVAINSTEAVRNERELTLSEARWRALVENLRDITVLLVDETMLIRLATGAGAMRQGLDAAAGKRISDISKPANARKLTELLERAFVGEEGTTEINASSTGSEHEIVVTPMPPDGGVAQALILGRDVSRERARERAIVQAKDRAERLFEHATYGVALLSPSGVVTQANPAFRLMVGLTSEETVGLSLADLSRSAEDETIPRHFKDLYAGPNSKAETEWTLPHSDGHDVHLHVSSTILPEESGSGEAILVNFADISERFRYELQLAHQADHDALTGLANRRRFDVDLEAHLDYCRRYGATGALLLLDLDNFKEVNDTLGHAAGDQLLVSMAGLLQGGIRSTDVVARLGGDEFAILIRQGGRAAAELVAQNIIERVQRLSSTFDGTRRRVTASIGVVLIRGENTQGSDLLAAADMTMYDAKEAGRNQYVVLDHAEFPRPRMGARLEWKDRIERALENDDFVLHLQPILDLRSGVVRGAEVLVRLADTDELVAPSRFIYIAERADLIVQLDTWILRRSVALLADLLREWPDFKLAVNLSGLSIGNADLEQALVEALQRHEVDPGALILEITETAAVADVKIARKFAERLTSLGCKFALDDFGAGFGSFYYLKHLLFDYVKIDGEFVANCHRNPIDRTILRSIVGIAHDLGKKTVAEYVADQEILDVVNAEGVDFAQGYLVGKPMPVDQFLTELRAAGGVRNPVSKTSAEDQTSAVNPK